MFQLNDLQLHIGYTQDDLLRAAARRLRVPPRGITGIGLLRQSVDARKKNDVHYTLSVWVSVDGKRKVRPDGKTILPYQKQAYRPPHAATPPAARPVVVGSGPAGLFCALTLAHAGIKPILLERGRRMEDRVRDVASFFHTGKLSRESNIQFGEGGAGTFSDGKLTTGTRDIRQKFVLEQFVEHGAPEDILYLAKPHIGTDRLRIVIKNMREHLLQSGCDIHFDTKLTGLRIQNGRMDGIVTNDGTAMDARRLVLAIGHSARDTFAMLHTSGIALIPKKFACGVRIEHAQQSIDASQYGSIADFKSLPAADYKLAHHAEGGRSAYTFCVCPGGSVVAAASEENMLATNGMSEYARDGLNCNGALLVNVDIADFDSGHPLAGIAFQRRLEAAAFRLGGGGYVAPAQLVGDFLENRATAGFGGVAPTYLPGVRPANLHECLPSFIAQTLRQALPAFGRAIAGFDAPDAVLTAVESRSSSPVRIVRGDDFQSNIRGVFPCGEGAGYAGGIMSAAVDGVKCAEAIIQGA